MPAPTLAHRAFLAAAVLVLAFAIPSPAQTKGSPAPQKASAAKATFVQAEAFAESIPVRNMPATHTVDKESSAVAGAEKEINEENRLAIRHFNPNIKPPADTVLSSLRSARNVKGELIAPQALPTPAVNFEGISKADTVALGQGYLPPDTNGAVGPNHYVQTVNVCFRIWNKNGTPATATTSFATLFSPLGCGNSLDGDPIVLYDQLADRWLISEFCTTANPNDHQLVAISKTNDPTGAYYLYDFPMPNNKFNDYPHLSVWPDGYYMTDNQFNQAGSSFLQDGVFAFNRAKMLVGDPTASFVYFDTAVLFPPGSGNTGPDGISGMLPANVDGYLAPPVGAPCPFAYFESTVLGGPADTLRIFDFHANFTTPASSSFSERVGSPLAVAAFNPGNTTTSRNIIPEPPPATTSNYLDAINDRLMFRLAYRNFGSSEALLMNHTVNASSRYGVRWYELTRSSPAAAFTIAEQETYNGPAADTSHRWIGSVAVNFQGDIALGYSVSSTSVFPSIRYAAKLFTDPAGAGLAQGEQTMIAGAGAQQSTSGRWGDYSCMTVDPTDDCSFWFTQEYDGASSTSNWQTRIAKLTVGQQATSPRGTISGTITDCSSGAPIANAIVSISGGFWRASAADGTFSATLAPGTYTATVSKLGLPSAVSGNLVVSNNGNTVFNACLQGVPILSAGSPSVTAENYTPANSAADPGEYVTVNLPISNTGSANTGNLVATLQPTGGVTSPSGPQTYGVVTAGGSSVSKPFSFIANGACGSTLTLTLSLQDGASNLGTVTYTMTVGGGSSGTTSYTNATSLTIPDSGAASVYPSSINVSGVAGAITKVTVTLNNLSHTFPDDLDILLVSPTGAKFVIMSDAGGSNGLSNVTLTLDDAAATLMPNAGAITTGSWRPSNYATGGSDSWPAPAPAGPYQSPATTGSATFASVFNGANPNGTWSLYVLDDSAIDSGTLAGGWTLNITTPPVNNCVGSQVPLIVNGPPLSPVVLGTPYSFTFVASGNPAPTFSVVGALPPGLNLSPAGVLSGTVTSAGNGSFPNIIVTATNNLGSNTQTFTLQVVTTAGNYLSSYNLTGNGAALTVDGEGDGIANLMEYAEGLDPTKSDVSGLPVVTLKDYSGTKYLSMIFHRSSLATDITYIVEGSNNLVNWTALGTSAAGGAASGPGFVTETGGPPTYTVEVRDIVPFDPNGNITRFIRLKVTSP